MNLNEGAKFKIEKVSPDFRAMINSLYMYLHMYIIISILLGYETYQLKIIRFKTRH